MSPILEILEHEELKAEIIQRETRKERDEEDGIKRIYGVSESESEGQVGLADCMTLRSMSYRSHSSSLSSGTDEWSDSQLNYSYSSDSNVDNDLEFGAIAKLVDDDEIDHVHLNKLSHLIAYNNDNQSYLEVVDTNEHQTNIEENAFVLPSPVPSDSSTYALTTDLILEQICLNLSVQDLKNVRSINTLFNKKATSRLLKEQLLEISIWYSLAENSYIRFRHDEHPTELKLLNDLIHSSGLLGKFPCTSFRFCVNLEFNLHMANLFSIYGNHMRSISLTLDEPLPVNVLRELLLKKAPNLERLEFRPLESCENQLITSNDNTELFPSSPDKSTVILPHLKYLYVGWKPTERVKRIVRSLLLAAVNLEAVEGFRLEYYNIFQEANKIQIIKDFHFFPSHSNKNFAQMFTKVTSPSLLTASFPKLTTMTIDFFDTRKEKNVVATGLKALTLIMEMSSTTLRKLSLSPIGQYPEFKLPKLKNVKELRFMPWSLSETCPIFSPHFSVRWTFPNLRVCDLSMLNLIQDGLVEYFPGEQYKYAALQTFHTVQYLKINNAVSEGDLLFISNNFLNVTNMTIYCLKGTLVPNRIWILPEKVASIEFYGVDVETLATVPHSLDSMFTGIPIKVCENLSQCKDPKLRARTQLEELQEHPSIVNLKNLKNLNVVFYQTVDFFGPPYMCLIENSDRVFSAPIVSDITIDYAFSLMPSNLNISFSYDHRSPWFGPLQKMLLPLSRFISIEHHDETYFHLEL